MGLVVQFTAPPGDLPGLGSGAAAALGQTAPEGELAGFFAGLVQALQRVGTEGASADKHGAPIQLPFGLAVALAAGAGTGTPAEPGADVGEGDTVAADGSLSSDALLSLLAMLPPGVEVKLPEGGLTASLSGSPAQVAAALLEGRPVSADEPAPGTQAGLPGQPPAQQGPVAGATETHAARPVPAKGQDQAATTPAPHAPMEQAAQSSRSVSPTRPAEGVPASAEARPAPAAPDAGAAGDTGEKAAAKPGAPMGDIAANVQAATSRTAPTESQVAGARPAAAEPPASLPNGFSMAEGPGIAPRPESRSGEVRPAGVPPDEGGGQTQPDMTRLVRTVGSASQQGQTQAGTDGQAGDRGTPNAAPQAVEHAADASAVAQLRQTAEPAPASSTQASGRPQAPQPQAPPMQQVARVVIERADAGGGEARLHLEPKELGEVTVRLRTEGDRIHVEIRADRVEAMQLLRQQSGDLGNLLNQRGLQLGDVFVGLGRGEQQGQGRHGEPGQAEGAGDDFASLLGIEHEDEASVERHNRVRAAYNPDGAHLFRV